MDATIHPLKDNCEFQNVHPIMRELPYPPMEITEKNWNYANILSFDYCGAVSEFSAIAQYVNHENRLSCSNCEAANTILGIAMAEMIHMQKLGQMILLLGGSLNFSARHRNGNFQLWTPRFLSLPKTFSEMIQVNIQSEHEAIAQYELHKNMIHDPKIHALLNRIIQDEEYHIQRLNMVSKEIH